MIYDVVITEHANETATLHLLSHLGRGQLQEDLCFALWAPSTGNNRTTAIVHKVVLPRGDERELHGGASFLPAYLTRSLLLARSERCGLAFMHSHLTAGWQDMSEADIVAERDVLAPPANATKLPLVGLTVGTDGYWSARFWIKSDGFRRHWCTKVRVVGKDKYSLFYNNGLLPPPPRRPALQRTYDTWGAEAQSLISRLHVGVVGLGSVGSVVTEALARVGVPVVTLVDPDVVQEHNLDRLLNATQDDVGRPKVDLAKAAFASHATTASPTVHAIFESIHTVDAYRAILDCDLVFSCVDRPGRKGCPELRLPRTPCPGARWWHCRRSAAFEQAPVFSSLALPCQHAAPPLPEVQRSIQHKHGRVGTGRFAGRSFLHAGPRRRSFRPQRECLSVHALPGKHARQPLPPLHHLRNLVAEARGRSARAAVRSQHPRLDRPRGLRRTLRVPRHASDRGCRGTAVPVAPGIRIPRRAFEAGHSLPHPHLPRYLIPEDVISVPEILFQRKSVSIVFLTFSL